MTRSKGESRREKRRARKEKREEKVLSEDEKLEQSVDDIMERERTEKVNEEGYHFVRPNWHRWVYGGGKKDK